jgi:hypothetical protein
MHCKLKWLSKENIHKNRMKGPWTTPIDYVNIYDNMLRNDTNSRNTLLPKHDINLSRSKGFHFPQLLLSMYVVLRGTTT